MRLIRGKSSFAFITYNCAIGKNLTTNEYFIEFRFPFFAAIRKEIFVSVNKPKTPIQLLTVLLIAPYLLAMLFGAIVMVFYSLYIILGAQNVVNAIQDSRALGGFINILSIFCVTLFYLSGIVAVIKFLIW